MVSDSSKFLAQLLKFFAVIICTFQLGKYTVFPLFEGAKKQYMEALFGKANR